MDNIIDTNFSKITKQLNNRQLTRGLSDIDIWDVMATLILCAIASAGIVGLSYALSYLLASSHLISSLGTVAGFFSKHKDK